MKLYVLKSTDQYGEKDYWFFLKEENAIAKKKELDNPKDFRAKTINHIEEEETED